MSRNRSPSRPEFPFTFLALRRAHFMRFFSGHPITYSMEPQSALPLSYARNEKIGPTFFVNGPIQNFKTSLFSLKLFNLPELPNVKFPWRSCIYHPSRVVFSVSLTCVPNFSLSSFQGFSTLCSLSPFFRSRLILLFTTILRVSLLCLLCSYSTRPTYCMHCMYVLPVLSTGSRSTKGHLTFSQRKRSK